jgi:hypothetical protein
VALNPRDPHREEDYAETKASAAVEVEEAPAPVATAPVAAEPEWAEPAEELPESAPVHAVVPEPEAVEFVPPIQVSLDEPVPAEITAFDVANLSPELQDLHRRANRAAKVSMQDIKLLRPKDVKAGREHKDICNRLRSDLDKARKEYDRRFRAIQDHPVDYFYHWMLETLAEGDSTTLGEYPYPSPVLRH